MTTETLSDTRNIAVSKGAAVTRPSARIRRWRGRGLLLLGAVAILGAATAMLRSVTSPTSSGSQLTHTVRRGDLRVTVIEQGTLESSDNTEIKCGVRGFSTVIWVIENGTEVKPGGELVRLDTKIIEEDVSLAKTNTHIARATLEQSKANVAKAEIAVQAYLEGRYRSQMKTLEKELAIAQSNLNTAKKMLQQSEELFKRGYVTELEVEGYAYSVTQAELELEVNRTQIDVLERYTKEMALETLNGNLIASRSKLQADQAGLRMDEARRDRAMQELEACVVRADRPGLVIYPSAAAWKDSPDITDGATVRKDQVLLLMPDLAKMQVKVGIHESIIDRMKPGLPARVTLPDRTLQAEVTSVATVTRPAGWWTGNVVKYDTIVRLPQEEGLKPGMTAEVEITLTQHQDVLTLPVASVVETEEGRFCWVKTPSGPARRELELGDSNDIFMVVQSGISEGEEVLLNPLVWMKAAEHATRLGDKTHETNSAADKSANDRVPAAIGIHSQ